MKEVSNS